MPDTGADGSSGSTDSGTGGSDTASSGTGDSVEIVDFKYDPETLSVDAGTEVEFTNQDTAAHTATADDSSFDTDTLEKGDSATVTLDKPGTFTYFCRFHAFMKGTIEVK